MVRFTSFDGSKLLRQNQQLSKISIKIISTTLYEHEKLGDNIRPPPPSKQVLNLWPAKSTNKNDHLLPDTLYCSTIGYRSQRIQIEQLFYDILDILVLDLQVSHLTCRRQLLLYLRRWLNDPSPLIHHHRPERIKSSKIGFGRINENTDEKNLLNNLP